MFTSPIDRLVLTADDPSGMYAPPVSDDPQIREEVRQHLGRFLNDPADIERRIDGWIPFFSQQRDWTAREDRIAADFGTAQVRNDIRNALAAFGIIGPAAEAQIGSLNPDGSGVGFGWVPFFTNVTDPAARAERVAQDFGGGATAVGEPLSLDFVPTPRVGPSPSSLDSLSAIAPGDAPTMVDTSTMAPAALSRATSGISPLVWLVLIAAAIYFLAD